MKAHRALQTRAMRSIESTGLCFSDFTVLEILLHKGPLPVNTIASQIGITSGSGTTAIDRLQERDLVERRGTSGDRRTRVVHLTAAGRRLILQAFAKHADDMECAAGNLSPAERDRLASLLRKLGKAEANEDLQNES